MKCKTWSQFKVYLKWTFRFWISFVFAKICSGPKWSNFFFCHPFGSEFLVELLNMVNYLRNRQQHQATKHRHRIQYPFEMVEGRTDEWMNEWMFVSFRIFVAFLQFRSVSVFGSCSNSIWNLTSNLMLPLQQFYLILVYTFTCWAIVIGLRKTGVPECRSLRIVSQ